MKKYFVWLHWLFGKKLPEKHTKGHYRDLHMRLNKLQGKEVWLNLDKKE